MALGTDVDGYVMPMFASQTAIAYNPALVENPPKSYAEIADWAKAHPQQFGYNGIKGGASGVSFVMGWIYAFGDGDAKMLMNGPFEEGQTKKWDAALASLKDFNTTATLTPGNAGTLDMLGRGEIAMGPVWVDMFYSWQADGKLPPEMKLLLPAPGMPGQPMHYVIPEKAPHAELAEKFVELATSPKVQAEGIVKRFNWYPGIDAKHVQAEPRPGVLGQIVQGRDAGRPRPIRQALPDRALQQRDPGSLRAPGRQLSRDFDQRVVRPVRPGDALGNRTHA
ncbi:extracellular solute-binding protein [Jiella pelagia]|uniref:Extracellular solute-binding protein n=1 Tax=Jiella pelagia TaxID=2986949 RepID=A0ABY7C7C1_9HYPH|nr:extracellular solute-binding protein [Jiella pelagia]WAP70954.1 extracellular solute-binding protein [Jiella pelagia]